MNVEQYIRALVGKNFKNSIGEVYQLRTLDFYSDGINEAPVVGLRFQNGKYLKVGLVDMSNDEILENSPQNLLEKTAQTTPPSQP